MKRIFLSALFTVMFLLAFSCVDSPKPVLKNYLKNTTKVIRAGKDSLELAIYIKKVEDGQHYWLVVSYVGKIDLDKLSLGGPVQIYFLYNKKFLKDKLEYFCALGFPYVPFVPGLDDQITLDSLKSNTSDVPYCLIGHEQVKRGKSVFIAQLLGTDKDSYLGEYTVLLLENSNLGLSYQVAFARGKGVPEAKKFMKGVVNYYFQKIK